MSELGLDGSLLTKGDLPAQNVSLSGSLHAHTAWRPLSNLKDEDLHPLGVITKKLTTSLDVPQNQIGSKPAIE